jgi:hypothetical protein
VSHQHACDVAGHYWECDGIALRAIAGRLEPTICMCPFCDIPMEEGDHSECPVELLACPQHQDEQLQETGEFRPSDPLPNGVDAECCMFNDLRGMPIVGFCLWCGIEFYSVEEVDGHNANDGKACHGFQRLKKGF